MKKFLLLLLPLLVILSCSKPAANDSAGTAISPDILDFGRVQSSATITLTNLQSASLSWNAVTSNNWIQLDKVSGVLRGGQMNSLM